MQGDKCRLVAHNAFGVSPSILGSSKERTHCNRSGRVELVEDYSGVTAHNGHIAGLADREDTATTKGHLCGSDEKHGDEKLLKQTYT
jgi:hypothetical protein